MKKLLSLFIITSLFSGELEVDGNLKVSGNINAQNQAIKNVGVPQELTDAINGNVLQDALRNDTDYEFTIILVYTSWNSSYGGYINASRWVDISDIDNDAGSSYINSAYYNPINTLSNKVSELINQDWQLDSINAAGDYSWWIFKKPIEE